MSDALDYLNQFDPSGQNTDETAPATGGMAYLDKFDPSVVGQIANPYDTESSATGTFARAAERSALPTAGGLAGAAAGAEVGGGLGAFGGPLGATVGAFGGGLAGAMLGGAAVESAQNWLVSKLPEGAQSYLGGTEKQQSADWEKHGVASLLGGVAPYMLTASPGFAVKELPAGASKLEQLLNTKTAQAAVGGTVMGGMTLGQELASGQPVNGIAVAISTGLGMFWNRPNRLGETIMGAGAAPVQRAIGIEARPEPTIAEAGDLKVAGPGVTEDVYQGTENQAKTAEAIAQNDRREEVTATAEPPVPDIHAVARQMEPELFARYDAAQQRFDALDKWSSSISERASETGEEPTPQLRMLQDRVNDAQAELDALGPEMGAAWRRAAEATGSPVEPAEAQAAAQEPQAPEAALAPSREQMAANIAEDVKGKLIAAGRPEEEADASGRLIAEYYATRAARFRGALGNAEELYRNEGAEIRGASGAQATPAPLAVSDAKPTVEAPKQPNLSSGGDIEPIDPREIGVDAKRFQFKSNGDEKGVTERLKDVPKWDARLAGTSLVWRDTDGKNWIADGHQRLSLAKRLIGEGQSGIKLNAFVLRAADGISDADARVIAAVKNIAEGTGSPIDAAKIMREAKEGGIDLPPMPPRSALVKDGQALAKLSPEAFGMAVNEVVPVNFAAMVGRLIGDPAVQVEAMRVLAKAEPDNVRQAELIVREILETGTETATQENLFGKEAFASSVVLERAKIADEALRQLRRDKTTFKTLVDESERIQSHGENTLDIGANKERLTTDEQASQFLTQLATRKGPVSDALSGIARRFKSGDISASAAAREFLGSVRSAVESGLVERANTGGAVAGAESEHELAQRDDQTREMFQRGSSAKNIGQSGSDLFTDAGPEGTRQTIIPGVAPLSDKARMEAQAKAPLRGGNKELPFDSLFGGAKDQQELFQGARGKIRLNGDARPIITLMKNANASTFIHESGHQFLEQLMRDAVHPAAPDALKTDAVKVSNWLGIKPGTSVPTRAHERFARGFEQYLREGVAPSRALASVFAKFKTWLTTIYQSIKGLGAPISDDIRGVFDRMLAEEPQPTVIAPETERQPSLADIHEADAILTEPKEAEPAMARVESETLKRETELPPHVRPELGAAAAAGQAHDLAGAGGSGADETNDLGGNGGNAGAKPGRASNGGGPGEKLAGGGNAGQEGAGSRGGTGPESIGGRNAGGGAGHPIAPTARDTSRPNESAFVDKAGNIRLDNVISSTENEGDLDRALEDIKQVFRDTAAQNGDFLADRRGVVTDGEVLQSAYTILGREPDFFLAKKIGQAFNAEENKAIQALGAISAKNVIAKMQAVRDAPPNSPEGAKAVTAYAQAKAFHQTVQAKYSQATAESGRALRALRKSRELWTPDIQSADEFIRRTTGKTLYQMEEEARLGASLFGPEQVSKFIADADKRSFGRMILEYWINGLISGPATHITYAIGNTVLSAERVLLETPTAAAIGALRHAMGREGNVIPFGETAAQIRGARRGVAPAAVAAADAMRTGLTTALPAEPNKAPVLAQNFQPGTYGLGASMKDNATAADAMQAWYGLVKGMRDGVTSAGALLSAGGVENAPLVSAQQSLRGVIPNIAIKGVPAVPLGDVLRGPGRFIAAIHSFFRAMNYSIDINGNEYRQAWNEGHRGDALSERIANLSLNRTPEAMEAARASANETTLMAQGGEFTRKLAQLTNVAPKLPVLGETPILKFIDPFVHISSAIINQGLLQRTPLGVLAPTIRADLAGKNGSVAQDKATARMLVGSALAVTFGALAAEGYVTGSGPQDPRQAATWKMAGNQAHSVKIDETWYDLHRLGPIGMLLGMAADLYGAARTATTEDLATGAAHLQHAIAQNVLDESFMRGPADLIKALTDKSYAPIYVRDFVSSFTPFSVGMSQTARAVDPYSRQARTIIDAIKQKVPGLSEGLLARRDIWGDPVQNPEALGMRGLTAIYERQVSHDPVNIEMQRLGIAKGNVARRIRNVTLTDQQYDDFARIAGRMTKSRLDQLVGSQTYEQMPDYERRNVIDKIFQTSREAARGVMFGKYPQILRDAVDRRRAKATGTDIRAIGE